MDFYATPFPWAAISECIDNVTYEFKPSPAAVSNFESATRCKWANLDDPEQKSQICSSCGKWITIPWTNGSQWSSSTNDMTEGFGYADNELQAACEYCKLQISHNYLRAQKFREDVTLLLRSDLPLAGTVLNRSGQPELTKKFAIHSDTLPNLLLQGGLGDEILVGLQPNNPTASMEAVKKTFENGIVDASFLKRIRAGIPRISPSERTSIRKCMSRYWFNSSPFALDLVGAVIRQGSFVDKMHGIDWLHSPALFNTMTRLIEKYQRFIDIMASHPRETAVPTLDVDLAWHTHQLDPKAYYVYTNRKTMTLINHDDKIEETKLSDAFTWTSKTYQDKYAEPYSSCTCWYCEAVRESHTSKMSRLFKSGASKAIDSLHASTDPSLSDPLKSPHISAHNAVRDTGTDAAMRSAVHAAQIDRAYQKACARARKQKRPEPVRDQYFYSSVWGYPMAYPLFYPYAVPIGIGLGYPGPCGGVVGVDSGVGAYGNCAAGTCGGMAAYGGGACAGVGGNCGGAAGGAAGACGGGGGGGGGCGGGGGGCGGGGGGCGGGGG